MSSGSNNSNKSKVSSGHLSFPDPLAKAEVKMDDSYGLQYAKAIDAQWGLSATDTTGLFSMRWDEFESNRQYANGTHNTDKFKTMITSQDPTAADGTYLSLDWKPVAIVPKFVKVVAEKILSRRLYPSVEAVDPISSTDKENKKAKMEFAIENKELIQGASQAGVNTGVDPNKIPDSTEEAEIFDGYSLKANSEIAGQLAISLTLDWSDYEESVHRRCVYDEVELGMGVNKRVLDPNYGIINRYVDPHLFVHSLTDDRLMKDIVYAGDVERIPIAELKRRAGDKFTEEEYGELAKNVGSFFGNDISKLKEHSRGHGGIINSYGYDSFLIDVLNFEYKTTETKIYEEKVNRWGNKGFYKKDDNYQAPENSVFERKPYKLEYEVTYGGTYIINSNKIYGYSKGQNMPRNIHDISRTNLSYNVSCVNLRNMIPQSFVSNIKQYADMLQLTHFKIQQSIAKAKPDGLIINIDSVENTNIGMGEMTPLQLQDVYEQTGVFYYRSTDPEGQRVNPPIASIDNQIRNIRELIGIYNHYLNMIRDVSGVNEVVDGSSPSSEALVGVRQQAISASNNALNDIASSSINLYHKTCQDILKCLQVLPQESVLFKIYEKAIGQSSMEILASFKDIPLYNYGVKVSREMSEEDKLYLEQNMQVLMSKERLDLEDAMAVRQIRDVDQAQRLLSIRTKRRQNMMDKRKMEAIYAAADADAQRAQKTDASAIQRKAQETKFDIMTIDAKAKAEIQVGRMLHPLKIKEIQEKNIGSLGFNQDEQTFKKNLEVMKEDRKDERLDTQTSHQAELIEQRKTGEKPVIIEKEKENNIAEQLIGK
jgi:hypothetical protein